MAMGKLVQFKPSKRSKRVRKSRPVASKVLRQVIQKEINKDAETKYKDNAPTTTPYLVDATAEAVAFNNAGNGIMSNILQGTTAVTRIGNEIRVKRISLRFRATAFSATATATLFIVRFPQCNGATEPTLANVWQQVNDIAVSHRDEDYLNDYHILGKITIQATAGTTLNRMYSWSKTYKNQGLKVEYDANADADGSVEYNNIYLIAQANGSDDTISLSNMVFRVEYKDI